MILFNQVLVTTSKSECLSTVNIVYFVRLWASMASTLQLAQSPSPVILHMTLWMIIRNSQQANPTHNMRLQPTRMTAHRDAHWQACLTSIPS